LKLRRLFKHVSKIELDLCKDIDVGEEEEWTSTFLMMKMGKGST